MLPPRVGVSLGALILPFLLCACGGGSPSAPTPSGSAPTPSGVVQVAGQWQFSVRITSITGGGCLSSSFAFNVGRVFTQPLTLQQDGSALTGGVPATVYGVGCNLTGDATQSAISLRTPACEPLLIPGVPIPVQCPSGGELMIFSPAVAADITTNGNTGTGTYSETFNVSTRAGEPVTPMTLTGSATMTRQ